MPAAVVGQDPGELEGRGGRHVPGRGEVAAIIGRPGRDLSPEGARDHIAGYAIFNDWSGRDLQGFDRKAGMGWAKGKDFASTLGPWSTSRRDWSRPCSPMPASGVWISWA